MQRYVKIKHAPSVNGVDYTKPVMQRYVKIKHAPSLMPKSFWLNFIAISL